MQDFYSTLLTLTYKLLGMSHVSI